MKKILLYKNPAYFLDGANVLYGIRNNSVFVSGTGNVYNASAFSIHIFKPLITVFVLLYFFKKHNFS